VWAPLPAFPIEWCVQLAFWERSWRHIPRKGATAALTVLATERTAYPCGNEVPKGKRVPATADKQPGKKSSPQPPRLPSQVGNVYSSFSVHCLGFVVGGGAACVACRFLYVIIRLVLRSAIPALVVRCFIEPPAEARMVARGIDRVVLDPPRMRFRREVPSSRVSGLQGKPAGVTTSLTHRDIGLPFRC
jgi:hypothetical protein